MEVTQGTVFRLREAEERADFRGHVAGRFSDFPNRRGNARNDAVNDICTPLNGLRRECRYPVYRILKALYDYIADFPDGGFDAGQQIQGGFFDLVPVFPEENANGNRRSDGSDDWSKCPGQNRDDRSGHLDNHDDALDDDKPQFQHCNDRFHNRNNGQYDADDGRDAFYGSDDSHHAHGNSADGLTDVRPFFLVNLPARQFLEELSNAGSHLIDFFLNRIECHTDG